MKKEEAKPAEKKTETKSHAKAGVTSDAEQLGEKAPGVDPSSQANNQGTARVNDGSAAGGYNTTDE